MSHPSNARYNDNGFVASARQLTQRLGWLTPAAALSSTASREFGRGIEAALANISETGEAIRLKLRKRDAAVVMSLKQYEDIVRMKEFYDALLDQTRDTAIEEATGEYEVLYQQITSAKSRRAVDELFTASGGDLGETWQPGQTENR